MNSGLSVVVCCYNSVQRLRPTLEHLARQKVPLGLEWEVVLVDNASTDGTADFARQCWQEVSVAPLRILREAEPGLSAARLRGIREARYEIISFIDDDNWVCADWLALVAEIMDQHPEVGACGGLSEAVYEIEPPGWLFQWLSFYAVGPQGAKEGDVTWERGWLFGAGLSIRRSALEQLAAEGFRASLSDRTGAQLSTGGDVELCFALRAAGWRLWYNPRLRLQHFLPAGRLTWTYLRRLNRSNGAAYPIYAPYRTHTESGIASPVAPRWTTQLRKLCRKLFRYGSKLPRAYLFPLEGDRDVLRIEQQVGWLFSVLRLRDEYERHYRHVQTATWNRLSRGRARDEHRPAAQPGI